MRTKLQTLTALLLCALVAGCATFEHQTTDTAAPVTPVNQPSLETNIRAALGDAVAQNNVGIAYARGLGVAKDEAEGVKWLTKAAEQGLAVAQANLGSAYHGGRGVTKDYSTAAKWYKRAADQNHAGAQYHLGFMHSYGQGVAHSDAEAVKYYRLAAEQGYALAQSNLGVAYWEGIGVAKDQSKGVRWLLKAAEQGLAVAQLNLAGRYYTGGEGVKKDLVEAYAWLGLAAGELRHLAAERESLAKGMSPEQILAGNKLESELRAQIKARLKGRPVQPQAVDLITI